MTISLLKLLKIYRFERVIRRKTATQLNKGANSSLLLLFSLLFIIFSIYFHQKDKN
jgi:hypothetical protein